MTLLIIVAGCFLTLLSLLFLRNPNRDMAGLFIQALFYIAPFLFVGVYLLMKVIRRYSEMSGVIIGRFNRYLSAVLLVFLFLVPMGNRVLLNDFIFWVVVLIICWCWVSWCYFVEVRLSDRTD